VHPGENVQRGAFGETIVIHVPNAVQSVREGGAEAGRLNDEEITKEGEVDLL
jgi:hypothetical protein